MTADRYTKAVLTNLLLEATDGTYRVVDLEGKAPEYPKVKIQFKFN